MIATNQPAIGRNVMKGCTILCFLFLSIFSVNAQTFSPLTSTSIIKKTSIDWSFVTQMGDTKYVDVAKAPFSIKEIQIISINKELLLIDQVNDLPSSTLYELNLTERLSGFYVLHIIGKRQAISKLFYLK